ncbi:hypothetical protein [Brevibacillus parabrevis]|uniref:hypothetical protein n=1 Tax=Brevibacillus parabrevis TaxID=54914 RepID=UPI003D1E7882
MTTNLDFSYDDLFVVTDPSDWCKHKKTLWKLLMDHIDVYFNSSEYHEVNKTEMISYVEKYFDATNFAYAYYKPTEGKSLFLIAKSKDSKNHINKIGDLFDIYKYFRSQIGLVFCTLRDNNNVFKFHRLDRDLSFKEISPDPTNGFLATQQTCCERIIFENIVWNTYGEEVFQEDFQPVLEGDIKIYTEFEPCIRCYGLMRSIKENHMLNIEVYYSEWVPEELQLIEDIKSFTSAIHALPPSAFGNNGDIMDDVLRKICSETISNGVTLDTAFVRVAQQMGNQTAKSKSKCNYKE